MLNYRDSILSIVCNLISCNNKSKLTYVLVVLLYLGFITRNGVVNMVDYPIRRVFCCEELFRLNKKDLKLTDDMYFVDLDNTCIPGVIYRYEDYDLYFIRSKAEFLRTLKSKLYTLSRCGYISAKESEIDQYLIKVEKECIIPITYSNIQVYTGDILRFIFAALNHNEDYKVFNEDFLDLLDRFSRDVVSPTSSESTYYDHRFLETKWTAGGYHCSKSIPAHERVQVLVSLYQKDPQYYSVIDFCSYCGWNDGKYPGKKDINRRRWQDYYAFKNYVSMINSR